MIWQWQKWISRLLSKESLPISLPSQSAFAINIELASGNAILLSFFPSLVAGKLNCRVQLNLINAALPLAEVILKYHSFALRCTGECTLRDKIVCRCRLQAIFDLCPFDGRNCVHKKCVISGKCNQKDKLKWRHLPPPYTNYEPWRVGFV